MWCSKIYCKCCVSLAVDIAYILALNMLLTQSTMVYCKLDLITMESEVLPKIGSLAIHIYVNIDDQGSKVETSNLFST